MPDDGYDRWAFERAVRQSTLTPNARLVALVLATRVPRDTGAWALLSRTLAADSGLGRASVFKALRELEDRGFLLCHRRSGATGRRASIFQLKHPKSATRTLPKICAESATRTDSFQPDSESLH